MTFQWIKASDAKMEQAYALRKQVFVEEQGFSATSEQDNKDDIATHIIGCDKDGVVLCTGRMYEEAPGVYHIGRIAVFAQVRGKGIGRQMVHAMEARAKTLGARAVTVGAQHDKVVFYERCGFAHAGKEYEDEGYRHVEMRKAL